MTNEYEAAVRLGIRTVLERAGFYVIGPTCDGRKAVELAALHRPYLAVLGEELEAIGVIDSIRQIRKVSPRTRIALMAGYTQGRTIMNALRAGVCSVIV